MGSKKGFGYERELCRKLSLWWSTGLGIGPRDDLFWRTAGSGGRATNRGKAGKTTAGQYGDICATDPLGQPLIDVIAIEAKRGYPRATIHDLLDCSDTAREQEYEKWIRKAEVCRAASGAILWVIIHRRDRHRAMVSYPMLLSGDLGWRRLDKFVPRATLLIEGLALITMGLDDFLDGIDPKHLCEVARKHNKDKQKVG